MFLLGATRSEAQLDQVIYDDLRQNGWEDYGWATIDYSHAVTVHGGSNSISVTAGPYQALYLHHAAFDSTPYTHLAFWIHGGTSGGQLLQLQMLLNGTAQAATNLPTLTKSWQQIVVRLGALGAANQPNVDGFWIQSRVGTNLPAFYVDDIRLVAPAAPAAVSVTVNAAQTVRVVDARYFGLNAVIWDAVFDTSNTVALLRGMDNRLLRFPGGSLSDEYHWASNTTLSNTWQWATSFSNFLHVATNLGSEVFITVNYGSGSAAEAAGWVRHANLTNAAGIKYWEVGNENYGSWEYDTNARPHDPWTYAQRFSNYFTLMKAADPSIKVGAVVVAGEDQYANYTDHPATNARTLGVHNGWTPVLLSTLKRLNVTPDFLIYHRYEQAPWSESDAALLQSARTWTNDAADLRRQLSDYLGPAGANVELVCTENNSVYTTPGKQSTSLVNGLFLADSIGNLLQTEFNACVWWALRNSQDYTNNNSSSLYGWRNYGDYGVTDGSNPSTPANRYPTYYVARLLKWFARGGDRVIKATSDYAGLSVFAASRTNGFCTLLVINKLPTNSLNANITLAGTASFSNALIFSYGIPQDEAARTNYLAGCDIARTNVALAGTNFSYLFPPYSVTVLALSAGPVVDLKALGLLSNGQARLQVSALPELRYAVQATSNLSLWRELLTNTLTGETLNWNESSSVGRSNFYYRARWLP